MNARLVVSLSFLLCVLSGCNQAPPAPLGAELTASGPSDGFVAGGSIDSISYDETSNQVTIEGWHMLTPKTKAQTLTVLAEGAVAVASVTARERPDVVEAVGDEDLLNSGFVLVLDLDKDSRLTRLCIMLDDQHYGRRFLYSHSPDFPPCSAP
jgi:hypothetical protein